MKIELIVNTKTDFSIHIDEMTSKQFDDIRFLLQTMCKMTPTLGVINIKELSFDNVISQISQL